MRRIPTEPGGCPSAQLSTIQPADFFRVGLAGIFISLSFAEEECPSCFRDKDQSKVGSFNLTRAVTSS